MPTYEYRCPDGHVFEQRAKMSEAASELACPVCGKIATRQLSGGAGLVFKGSGFYLTDYGKNAHRGTAPETSGSSSRKEGDSSSSESKNGDKSAASKPAESKPADTKSAESKESKSSDKSAGASASSSASSSKKSEQ